jgi:hypothetical protein
MGEVLPFPRLPQDPDTEPCRNCGHSVDRAAIRCRRCGTSTIPGRARSRSLPWWVLLGLILALAVVLGWIAGR